MSMTHYMELLATNQPWNLLIFMAGPVILAETVAITELYLLFTRQTTGAVRAVNRAAGILVGIYFIGIVAYLVPTAVVPITRGGAWRTWVDMLAVYSYLLAGLPMIGIALQDLGLINRAMPAVRKTAVHAGLVAAFLVLAHVAMVAGMIDPAVVGYKAGAAAAMDMPAGAHGQMPMQQAK